MLRTQISHDVVTIPDHTGYVACSLIKVSITVPCIWSSMSRGSPRCAFCHALCHGVFTREVIVSSGGAFPLMSENTFSVPFSSHMPVFVNHLIHGSPLLLSDSLLVLFASFWLPGVDTGTSSVVWILPVVHTGCRVCCHVYSSGVDVYSLQICRVATYCSKVYLALCVQVACLAYISMRYCHHHDPAYVYFFCLLPVFSCPVSGFPLVFGL